MTGYIWTKQPDYIIRKAQLPDKVISFCNIFGVKCTTMASDFSVPAERESAECCSQSASSAGVCHSLTCVMFVKLSWTLDQYWSQQGDWNISQPELGLLLSSICSPPIVQ